jgi:hypothetical protein
MVLVAICDRVRECVLVNQAKKKGGGIKKPRIRVSSIYLQILDRAHIVGFRVDSVAVAAIHGHVATHHGIVIRRIRRHIAAAVQTSEQAA